MNYLFSQVFLHSALLLQVNIFTLCTYKFVGFLFELVIRLIYFNCSIVHCVNVNAAVKVCFGLTLVEFEAEALEKYF